MAEPEQGIITSVIDCGSVVQVFIETDDGTKVLAADGNMFRHAQSSIGKPSLAGVRIEYQATDWGGLTWFAVIADKHVVCPACRKHIAPHLDPDFCMFGLHRRKTPPPANGVHADEA